MRARSFPSHTAEWLHFGVLMLASVCIAACLLPWTAFAQERPVELTAEEIRWRDAHPVISVGVFAGDHLPAEAWVAGRAEGLGVDYARLLAGKLGMRLSFHPFSDWSAAINPVAGASAPYDLLLGQAQWAEQPSRYAFLKPYGSGDIMLVARTGDTRIRGEPDLVNVRVVTERRYTPVIDRLKAKLPRVTWVFADDGRSALQMVADGRADAYAGPWPARIRYLLSQRPQDDLYLLSRLNITPAQIGPAVPLDRPILLALLRKAEASVTTDELNRLRSRWGVDEPLQELPRGLILSRTEREWLRALPVLRVGFEVDRAPYSYVDGEGRFTGLAAEYVDMLRTRLGLRLEMVPARDWNDLRHKVEAHEVDLVAATMPGDFSDADLLASRPYEHFPGVIVTRSAVGNIAGPEDLSSRTVAMREEAGLLPRMRLLLPRSQIRPVGSNEEGLALLSSGRVDAYIGTLPAIDPLIRDRYAAALRVAAPAGIDQDFAIGVEPQNARLLPLVDRALASVSGEQRQAIRGRWLTATYAYGVPWRLVLTGLLAALTIAVIVALAYQRLRRAVRAQGLAERRLAEQLAFQETLLETVPYPVFVKDADGRYVAVNRAYEVAFGCARNTLIGRTLVETVHIAGLDAEQLHSDDLALLTGGAAQGRRELQARMANDPSRVHHLLMWVQRLDRDDGTTTGMLGTMVDVTEIRDAEARARASEQLLKDTNDRLPGVIMRLNLSAAHLRCDYATGETMEMFGVSPEVMMTSVEPPVDAIHAEDREAVLAAARAVLRGSARREIEFRTLTQGRTHWVRASGGQPRQEENGSITWAISFADITEERMQADALIAAKDAAQSATEAKSTFLAMMSHEIRTPMAGVLSLLELLADTALNRDQHHLVSLVQDSAAHLLQILDDVLDFSRIESGRLELETAPCDLRSLGDGVAALFAARAQEKAIRLYNDQDWRMAELYSCDAVRVRQVVTNLISNALKFTEQGHVQLKFSVESESGDAHRLLIAVLDTGIGIAPDRLSRLFQPFAQEDGSIARRFGGSGLGLSISRRLAEQMGGSIVVRSTPGVGTQALFQLELPIVRRMSAQPEFVGRTVLLCTHDALSGSSVSNALSSSGLTVCEVPPEELSEALEGADLALVDEGLVVSLGVQRQRTLICLSTSYSARGVLHQHDGIILSTTPLLWRAALDACRAALGFESDTTQLLPATVGPQAAGRLLVAEDHAVNREVISRQLDRLGMTHDLVANGEEAWSALLLRGYDLLLTDCHMPEVDGFTLARRVRERERREGGHMPIVALSASALPEHIGRCMQAGMDDFISKPVRMQELQQKLLQYLPGLERLDGSLVEQEKAYPPQMRHLMEIYADWGRVQTLVKQLLDVSWKDMDAFDVAARRQDEAMQYELVHRVLGGLQLLGWDEAEPDATPVQQAERIRRRLRKIEALLQSG